MPTRFAQLQLSQIQRLEKSILELWETKSRFDRLRDRNRGNGKFSSIDASVTANKTMGVHTAWRRRRCAGWPR